MKSLRNQDGIALVTALLLTLITLGIIMAMMYYITQGIQVSAAHKRYKTALDAAHGGASVITAQIIPSIFSGYSSSQLAKDFGDISLALPNSGCLKQKLSTATSGWGGVCSTDATSLDPTKTPDATFILKGTVSKPNFKVYTKIVDTTAGNSDTSNIDYLESGASVAGASSGISPKHMPSVYRIEVQGERETNPQERANLSVFYAY